MDRLVRVGRFWNWVPQFVAIAESEHLPTAAARVHVTPPALSRTLKLIEDELGHPLFHRRRGRLLLTDDGRRLLEAARIAMRVLEEAYHELGTHPIAGTLWVAAGGVSQPLVVEALLNLRETHPALHPHLSTPDPDRVVDQLWRGELHVAFGSFVRRAPGLHTEVLGFERSSVWCGPRHPLYASGEASLVEVCRYPFIAPPPEPGDRSPEGWPNVVPRDIRMVVDRIALGVEIVGTTELLAVLPDSLAVQSRVPLRRVEVGEVAETLGGMLLPLTPVVAHTPEPVTHGAAVYQLLELLRARLSQNSDRG